MDSNQDTVRSTRELLVDLGDEDDHQSQTQTRNDQLTNGNQSTEPGKHMLEETEQDATLLGENPQAGPSKVTTPVSHDVESAPQSLMLMSSDKRKNSENNFQMTPVMPRASPSMSYLSVNYGSKNEDSVEAKEDGEGCEVKKGRVTFARRQDVVFITAQTSLEEESGPISPKSITSHGSNASKMSTDREKDLELEMKLCIALLFVFMVTSVALIFHFYNAKQLQIIMGQRLVYQKTSRDVVFYNHRREVALEGILGLNLNQDKLPTYCDGEHHDDKTDELCLVWKDVAVLNVSSYTTKEDVACYNISWQSLNPDLLLQDCFNVSEHSWYGMGLVYAQRWPLNKMQVNKVPFVVGSIYNADNLGPVLEPYFLSSAGVSIVVEKSVKLEVSLNAALTAGNTSESSKQLCLYAARPVVDHHQTLPHLKYTVCVARDIRQAYNVSRSEFIQESPAPPPKKTMQFPAWSTSPYLNGSLTQDSIVEFVDQIVQRNHRRSLLIVDGLWEYVAGSYDFDPKRFSNPKNLIRNIRSHGFDVLLMGHPYVNYNSDSFVYGVEKALLVSDQSGDIPGLTRWRLGPAGSEVEAGIAGVVDVTGPGQYWLQDCLKNVSETLNVDGWYLFGGQIDMQPNNPTFSSNPITPSMYSTKLTQIQIGSEQAANQVMQSGFLSQSAPGLIRVYGRTSTWGENGLASVLPTVLTLGIVGYPYILSEVIGGNAFHGFPSRELYIRWMQLSVFLPTVHFSIPPEYFDDFTSKLAKSLMQTRSKVIIPVILRAIEKQDLPIVRPLWLEWPNDSVTYDLDTQFLVGGEILVAPVLTEGTRRRDIYLPAGSWSRQSDSSIITGPKWLRDFSVPLSQVSYFVLTS